MKDKKKIIIPVILVLAAAAVVWWLVRPKPFYYAGTIEATEVTLSARVASVIASLPVQEGDPVLAGQTLMTLAGEDLRLAADLAEKEFRRGQKLLANGSITQAAFDQMKFKRDQASLMLSWCTIDSPVTGTVLNRYREPGEMVAPGTTLFTLADLSEVWAYIYVEQPRLAALTLGQIVEGSLPEMPDRAFMGKIVFLRPEAEFTPKNVQTRSERTRLVYGVKISFPNPDKILKPGMTIEVRLPEK